MTAPRKHHYLPQFFLRNFARNGQILRIDKGNLGHIRGSVKNLAAIRDFHRLDNDAFDDQFAAERQLGEIEGVLSASLRAVLSDGIKDIETRARIVELVSLLRMRVPAVKTFIEEALRGIVRTSTTLLERHGELPAVPEGLEEALRIDQFGIEISNWICLQYMFQIAADRDILRVLLSMTPTLVDAADGSRFVTSDQPVALFSPTVKIGTPYGSGLTEKESELTLALSSSRLLHLRWGDDLPELRQATTDEVAEYNRRTIIMAENYIFAESTDLSIDELIKENGCRHAGFKPPQVLDVGSAAYHLNVFRPVLAPDQYR